jgi:hypothetical protein
MLAYSPVTLLKPHCSGIKRKLTMLNFICLFYPNAHTHAVHTRFNQDLLILVS